MRVAGFGFRSGVSLTTLQALLDLAGGLDGITAFATAEDKAHMPALRKLSIRTRLPIFAISITQISSADVALSPRAPSRYGGRSLAEAAALIAAGPGGRLVQGRIVSADGMATVAIAEGPGL